MTLPAPRFALMTVAAVVTVIAVSAPHSGSAQVAAQSGPSKPAASSATDHADHSATQPSLADQLRKLQDKVARLEAALKQNHTGQSDPTGGMQGMSGMSSDSKMGMGGMKMGGGMMKGMSGMGMQGMGGGMMKGMGMMGGMNMGSGNSSDMSGMSMGGGSSGMGGMSGMGMGMMGSGGMGMMGSGGMGMGMMGRMKGMGQMQMASSLPGFPGASHIYHIGATSFFLDHSQHITLTPEQQTQLNKLKEAALLAQSSYDRQIEEAEQQLWVLTSADSPDATAVEARVGEIAKLSAEKRIAFIRAVGEAAGVLTDEQRKILIGYLPPDHASQNQGAGSDSSAHQH